MAKASLRCTTYQANTIAFQNNTTEKLCRYTSGSFSGAELNYHINEKEVLAIKKAIKKFSIYLLSKPFIIRTDNTYFKSFLKAKNPTDYKQGRLIRWQQWFNYYQFTVERIPGNKNYLADTLTREFRQNLKQVPLELQEEMEPIESLKEELEILEAERDSINQKFRLISLKIAKIGKAQQGPIKPTPEQIEAVQTIQMNQSRPSSAQAHYVIFDGPYKGIIDNWPNVTRKPKTNHSLTKNTRPRKKPKRP